VDRYGLGKRSYEALDHYCIAPGCDCATVRVRFYRQAAPGAVRKAVGSVWMDANTTEVVRTDNPPGEHDTLLALWRAYEERHDLGDLAERLGRVRRTGLEIHELRERQLRPQPARRGSAAGRNDPCPCGSGRKHKKCCLGRAS
jgi:hypothetical protein